MAIALTIPLTIALETPAKDVLDQMMEDLFVTTYTAEEVELGLMPEPNAHQSLDTGNITLDQLGYIHGLFSKQNLLDETVL